MNIKNLIITILALYFAVGCKLNSNINVPESVELETPHEINCENMFVVGDKLVLINNSSDYFFDYYLLPDISYAGSFGKLSRNIDGFSMIPSPDMIRVVSDSSFVSDNRIVTFTSSPVGVNVSSYLDSTIIRNHAIDSILNSKISSILGYNNSIYARSDLIDGMIYSLLYKTKGGKMHINKDIPELHRFDINYNLLDKFALSYPLITYTVSKKYNKIYTLSADSSNIIRIYNIL